MATQPFDPEFERRLVRQEETTKLLAQAVAEFAKIRTDVEVLNAKVDGLNAKIDAKVDGLRDQFDTKLNGLREEISRKPGHGALFSYGLGIAGTVVAAFAAAVAVIAYISSLPQP
jgi:tetrahydromethanopterin S-methyltransferase subunit B